MTLAIFVSIINFVNSVRGCGVDTIALYNVGGLNAIKWYTETFYMPYFLGKKDATQLQRQRTIYSYKYLSAVFMFSCTTGSKYNCSQKFFFSPKENVEILKQALKKTRVISASLAKNR